MKCIQVQSLGNPTLEVGKGPLQLVEIENPKLKTENEVLIQILYAGLNFFDLLIVQGLYQEKPKLPFVPGAEISGIVIQTGKNVSNVCQGDSVVACCPNFGGFAQYCVLPQALVFKLPLNINLREAAGFPTVYGTAHLTLKYRANIQSNQTILILGASGGVGSAAVQICKHYNLNIIAVARGNEKCDYLKSLGVKHVIDLNECRQKGELGKSIRRVAPKGVDVMFDAVGGSQFKEGVRVMKWGAVVLIVGFASGEIPNIPANILLVKNLTVHGVYWGSYIKGDPQLLRRSMEECLELWGRGQLNVPVSHCFALSQVNKGLEVLKQRKVKGKVVLQVPTSISKL
eukprot:TRINITY_DN2716_c1_g1_i3.p1 TRINITY_DN2716_c1_g1~~TRINITY_DN2716_c1_g1_i3.p1  ORF type:complete len:343 (-),score=52.41 TRINITY_DN2716_c1_g1_i3:93-1121(-)